jgi:uncharacterized protein (TIGR02001 family)
MGRMNLRSLTVLTAALALPSFALAQEAPEDDGYRYGVAPSSSWAFGAGMASDGRDWGASRTDGDAHAWALAEWSSADRTFYAGPTVRTVKTQGSELEASIFAGWRPQVAGWDLDLGVTQSWLIDAAPGADDDQLTLGAAVIRSLGPVEGRLKVEHSPDGFGPREAWTWTELGATWDQSPALSWSAAVGRRDQEGAGVDYTGWNVGATWRLSDRFELDARWHDTDADAFDPYGDEDYEGRFVVGLSAYF